MARSKKGRKGRRGCPETIEGTLVREGLASLVAETARLLRDGTLDVPAELALGDERIAVRVQLPRGRRDGAGRDAAARALGWVAAGIQVGDLEGSWLSMTHECGCGVRIECGP